MALDVTIGGPSSDSYGTLADFLTYVTSMGWTISGDTTSQEANLRRATVYLDRQYNWVGTKAASTQARDWPREVVDPDPDGFDIPSDSIPQAIIDAQFELAWLENQGNDLLAFQSGAEVKRERVKAGPVESETEYSNGNAAESRLLSVEGLLAPYITGGQPGTQASIIRLARG